MHMRNPLFSPAALAAASMALVWAASEASPIPRRIDASLPSLVTFVPLQTATPTRTPTRTPTPVNFGNLVWDDRDADGVQDAGEPGLAGVQVQLWNGAKTQFIASTTTNSNGNYTLQSSGPGQFRIRVLLPHSNDHFSPKDAGSSDLTDSDINLAGGDSGFTDIYTIASNVISISSIDAGIVVYRPPTPTRTPTPINIGNFVWNDTNANGVQDAGEPGLNGITVQLWNSAKNDLIDSATTNANGNYSLIAPVPGDYRVRVLLPGGAGFAPKDVGGSDLADSDINASGIDFGFTDVFTLASNVISISSKDAGLIHVPATPTATATRTPTATATRTPTATLTGASPLSPRVYIPQARR